MNLNHYLILAVVWLCESEMLATLILFVLNWNHFYHRSRDLLTFEISCSGFGKFPVDSTLIFICLINECFYIIHHDLPFRALILTPSEAGFKLN